MDHYHQLNTHILHEGIDYIITQGEDRYIFRAQYSGNGPHLHPIKGDTVVIPGWGSYVVDNIVWDYSPGGEDFINVHLVSQKTIDPDELYRIAIEAMKNYKHPKGEEDD